MKSILSEKDSRAVLEILVEQLGVAQSQLTPEARLKEDLGADSLTFIEIVMALDDEFDISIPDEAAERVSTVGDIFDVLSEFVGNSRPKS